MVTQEDLNPHHLQRHWFHASVDLLDLVRATLLAIRSSATKNAGAIDLPHWCDPLLGSRDALRQFVINAVEGLISSSATRARAQGLGSFIVGKEGRLSSEFRGCAIEHLPLDPALSDLWGDTLLRDLATSLQKAGAIVVVGDGEAEADARSKTVRLKIYEKSEAPEHLRMSRQVDTNGLRLAL